MSVLVRYGIETPWYASLPRVEARFYIEHYSGADDVWVGKTLYRVAEISNNIYLELAKSDYNECQAQHQLEWIHMQEWWVECNLEEFGISAENVLHAYFLAAASIFEPERSIETLAWAKSSVIVQSLAKYFDEIAISRQQRIQFLAAFRGNSACSLDKIDEKGRRLVKNIQKFLHHLSTEMFQDLQMDIRQQLNDAWEAWFTKSLNLNSGEYPNEATLLVLIVNLSARNIISSKEMLHSDEYKRLSNLTNKVCHQLRQYQKIEKEIDTDSPEMDVGRINSAEIEAAMQEFVQLVHQSPPKSISETAKQTFLMVAKAFYYNAYCSKKTRSTHISKVLFEQIV